MWGDVFHARAREATVEEKPQGWHEMVRCWPAYATYQRMTNRDIPVIVYRHETDDGHDLGVHVERYRQLFNTVRPHQSLGGRRPLDVHLEACTTREIIKSNELPS